MNRVEEILRPYRPLPNLPIHELQERILTYQTLIDDGELHLLNLREIQIAITLTNGLFIDPDNEEEDQNVSESIAHLPLTLQLEIGNIILKCADKSLVEDQWGPIDAETRYVLVRDPDVLFETGVVDSEMIENSATGSYVFILMQSLLEKKLAELEAYNIKHVYPGMNAEKMANSIGHPNQRTKYVEDPDPDVGVRPELGFRDLPDELKKEIAHMVGNGFRSGKHNRLQKGSVAAKKHMAKLRALRQNHN